MRITVEEAACRLQRGEVVAIPTETVYGLAANIESEEAIQKIFSLKNRPVSNPLIVHARDYTTVCEYIHEKPPHFEDLCTHFWPGPLSLVLPVCTKKVPEIVRAGLNTCAFRVPSHPVAQLLLETCTFVAPSANLSGKPSGTCVEHIEKDFGVDFPVVEGKVSCGVESTILAFDESEEKWQLARLGAISEEDLFKLLGYRPQRRQKGEKPLCPGEYFRHYAPNTRLLLEKCPSEECVVGFSDRYYAGAKKVFALGATTDPLQVAHNLYTVLRLLDEEKIDVARVDLDIPDEGLWRTIKERLIRAASPT